MHKYGGDLYIPYDYLTRDDIIVGIPHEIKKCKYLSNDIKVKLLKLLNSIII